jgi:hypothetical protein
LSCRADSHPGTLAHYRAARQISVDADRGDASTEDLRQGLIHFRTVFGELIGPPDGAEPRAPAEPLALPAVWAPRATPEEPARRS